MGFIKTSVKIPMCMRTCGPVITRLKPNITLFGLTQVLWSLFSSLRPSERQDVKQWCYKNGVTHKLIAQLDNLCCFSLGLCIDCLDFHTQITRKYSTAMCSICRSLAITLGSTAAWYVTFPFGQDWPLFLFCGAHQICIGFALLANTDLLACTKNIAKGTTDPGVDYFIY